MTEKRISRIDLADYRDVDQIASAIFKLLPGLEPPIPVEELARELDITDIKSLDSEGFVGALITDRDKSSGVVLVKDNLHPQRRRFTIGHELGHFLCPTHIPTNNANFYCTAEDMRLQQARRSNAAELMEVQANRFSANLLMPPKLFRAKIPIKEDPNIQHILDLSILFDTSKETTTRRYIDLHRDTCAAVFSKQHKLRYCCRRSEFPYLNLKTNASLPHHCISSRITLEPGQLTEPEEVDPYLWLDDRQAKKVDYLSEQVFVQSDGYRITLLVAEIKDDESEEDEEALERSWTPRFHR